MKKTIYLFALSLLFSCGNEKPTRATTNNEVNLNEVVVLGTIHDGHLVEKEYSVAVLTQLIKAINPDVVLVEIPPDRFPVAMDEFKQKNTITEARVKRFPEYVNVIFPLTKEMNFKIIPTAAWTQEMSKARSAKLKEIREDGNRADEWNELVDAEKNSAELIKATGREFDPYFINSDEYDRLVEIELEPYNRLFNEELGLGGWDNINKAHFAYISAALDNLRNQGKRILITYGAGHKGWFLRELKKRTDIRLLNLEDIVPK